MGNFEELQVPFEVLVVVLVGLTAAALILIALYRSDGRR